MKIIFINHPIQDETTENPQLIDGKLFYWKIYITKLRSNSFQVELKGNIYFTKDVKYLLIYDAISIHNHFCDQGCTPGMGCKKEYSETNHALLLRYYKISEDTMDEFEKRKIGTEMTKQLINKSF